MVNEVQIQAIEARVKNRPFDAQQHHSSCRPSYVLLDYNCHQCGYAESAEQLDTDLVALLADWRVMQEVIHRVIETLQDDEKRKALVSPIDWATVELETVLDATERQR